jgi:hypothetical protein
MCSAAGARPEPEGGIKMVRGSCLCGTVRFEFSEHRDGVHMCHCSVCRKISGAAHSAVVLAQRETFRWLSGKETGARAR